MSYTNDDNRPSNTSKLKEYIKTFDFISTLNKGDKPCFNDNSIIDIDAWFVTFRRRLKGERGEHGVIHIRNILDSCDNSYRMCRKDEINILKSLRNSLDNSRQGFHNLIYTYSDQKYVKKGYSDCLKQVIKLIINLDKYIDELQNNKPRFFGTYPTTIESGTKKFFNGLNLR